MKHSFAEALVGAQGRSEFVIVVVADIRGFSAFSTINESPNIAMFIKRFYLQLINNYFKDANFVKPTGDGLLLTFPYAEDTLLTASDGVITACLNCLEEFPGICKNDPMINFAVPEQIGFGIARGTACCLFSGEETLDYSGHLLNLASRLNDIARPGGIVVDGNYLSTVIPESFREMFKEQRVYVRSIAEEVPMNIFYLDGYVEISDSSLTPLVGENWKLVTKEFTRAQITRLASGWLQELPSQVKSLDKLKVKMTVPRKGLRGISMNISFPNFSYIEEGPIPKVRLDINAARSLLATKDIGRNAKVKFIIEYVPKTLPRS